MVIQAPFEPNQPFPLVIRVVVRPGDLMDAALGDTEAEPAVRALVSLACTLLHVDAHPEALTDARLAIAAPLFDTVLEQEEPRATEDVRALWTFVVEAWEEGSPIRERLVHAVSPRAREIYTAVAAELTAEGRAAGS